MFAIRVRLRYAVLQHNFDKRMEVKNSYMPLSCFAHVSYMYVAQNMNEIFTV